VLKLAPIADFHTLLLVVKNISKKRNIAKNGKQDIYSNYFKYILYIGIVYFFGFAIVHVW
jgi:hypothetical protein